MTSHLKNVIMNEKIDVCFLHAGTELEELTLKNLLSQTKIEINVFEAKIGESYADSMNELISKGSSENIVIFPSNLLVENNWLEELLRYQQLIVNPGCVGIYDYLTMHKMKSNALLTIEDTMSSIWTTENYIEGVFLLSRKLMTSDVGMYDRLFDGSGYEQVEFTLKFAFAGHNNFYIRCKSSCSLKIPDRDKIFPTKTEAGTNLINEFVKANINFNEIQ